MAEDQADWSTDSNSAINISLVIPAAGAPKAIESFNPKFTYELFGNEETIFGYQGLKINLRYNACDMRPGLQITYNKKFKTVGETSPTDLKAILEDALPKTAFEKTAVFDSAISEPSYASWTPPGELLKTMEDGGKTFEIWKGSLADVAVQQMVKRIQILVPFFIEGGSFLDMTDPEWSLERWTVFFLYQKKAEADPSTSPYIFMGYSTTYRWFYLPPTAAAGDPPAKKQRLESKSTSTFTLSSPGTTIAFPCRSRISQFLILPPFQGGGNGSRFYNAIFDYYLSEAQTLEITVEDPNESFDDLRDLNDLARLRKIPEFASLRINAKATIRAKGPIPTDIVDTNTLEKLRSKTKIAPRQFNRAVEMQLLSTIDSAVRQSLLLERPKAKGQELKAQEHEYHLWQLLAKKRLYKHNKDALAQLDRAERVEKLDQVLGSVEADYARILRALDSRTSRKPESVKGFSNGKRASPDDEAGDDDGEPSAKRVKVAQ